MGSRPLTLQSEQIAGMYANWVPINRRLLNVQGFLGQGRGKREKAELPKNLEIGELGSSRLWKQEVQEGWRVRGTRGAGT